MTRIGSRIGVWMYRRWDGRLSSGRHDVSVLLLTVPGRRTGLPRETCVRFIRVPEGYLVWGTGSGSRSDPDWFRNLRRAPRAVAQVGADRFEVEPRELLAEERDAAWRDVVLAQAPEVRRYADRAGRTIPVAVLRPRAAS